ncbi:MAG: ABC transporter substrate-binding protein [Alphaproteobacteria bacterium]|nr:ABC transporter substrate-binding protein [Alphaproteobacteria bacterium]
MTRHLLPRIAPLIAVACLVLVAPLLALAGRAQAGETLVETPFFAQDVAAGKLPPVAERIPAEPAIVEGDAGKQGGDLHILMAGAKDTRIMVAYSYARLMRYNTSLEFEPDIAKSVDVENERSFTFHLRKGMRWSDGAPFTAEDFRYWYEDVALNEQISPSGLPLELLPDGEKPKVEFLDDETVRYSWTRPNPLFLPALAAPNPLYLYMPAHYLKQFHEKYADPKKLAELVKKYKQRNWAALHNRMDHAYRNDNPDLPSLEPWVLRTAAPAERFVFERNPFYHRIDTAGHQLPYIDRVLMSIADSKIIPAKTGAGESDLQARYIRFDNYTFLKDAEKRNNFTVDLWKTANGSQYALYPNLNVSDPAWRQLFRDVRFRRALSLAIDRHEINQAIYYGLGKEGQNTVLPGSPLYQEKFRKAWTQFDLKEANRLLDELGLTQRNDDGIRLLPDGRPLQIIVESSGESTEESDLLELIGDTWREAGIKLFTKPSQLTVFRDRIFSGDAMMAISFGIDNALVTADMPPLEFTPTMQTQLQWPKWGQFAETKGHAGEAPDMPMGVEMRSLLKDWFTAGSHDERRKIWENILAINADQVTSIGLVAGVPQPVVVSNRLRNVPAEGIYSWDPGAQFGVYHPDSFWIATDEQAALPATAPAAN